MVNTSPQAPLRRGFHVMAKPTGAKCNLDCQYCYFLTKERLYPGSRFRMEDDLAELYIRQMLESHPGPEVEIAWQGGEPTLMGLPFYRRCMEHARRHARPGQAVRHAIQTNGTLLNDEWGEFLRENQFLVGISLDGPAALHDAYRVDKQGRPTFEAVIRGLRLLQKHGVDFNILCTVHAANGDHPLEVYRCFRDDLGADWVQFIPIVERTGDPERSVTARSVGPEQYGRFLIAIFDEWVRRDVGRMFVQDFEVALGLWLGLPSSLCIHSETCGNALVMEHNGDVYSCDHFVTPEHRLGNIREAPLIQLAGLDRQRRFGLDKRDTLPAMCRTCDVRFACHGGCPVNRIVSTPDGEPGLNYLCAGYQAFFRHIDPAMRQMADLVRRQRPADEIMPILALQDAQGSQAYRAGRNDPCPCGSGRKFKKCHGANAEPSGPGQVLH